MLMSPTYLANCSAAVYICLPAELQHVTMLHSSCCPSIHRAHSSQAKYTSVSFVTLEQASLGCPCTSIAEPLPYSCWRIIALPLGSQVVRIAVYGAVPLRSIHSIPWLPWNDFYLLPQLVHLLLHDSCTAPVCCLQGINSCAAPCVIG